ncbi:hypothetical protein RIE95_10245 [Acidithiobacillus thiooxidans]|uniref:hypothetical protein n=1 Tax=Acidithiobacillus thiooxidans TaxID=930 RepID=UPI002861D20A|nr:hypothetical protein [Acidithiobacillus thiooxidans]MDR7927352.1 hypothetical protein [Acidithiobacillus thiooxidans]
MVKAIKDIYPTAVGALLVRLYMVETGKQECDPLLMIEWWSKKLEAPDDRYDWLSTKKWRQLARHIHAVIATNFPCLDESSGYDLGIETSLVPKPEIKINPDGTLSEHWSLEEYGKSLPPFGFETWQHPLKCIPCYHDPVEFDHD